MITPTITARNYAAIKSRQTAARASGDTAKIGAALPIVVERLAEAMDLTPGAKMLDAATDNGNVTPVLVPVR